MYQLLRQSKGLPRVRVISQATGSHSLLQPSAVLTDMKFCPLEDGLLVCVGGDNVCIWNIQESNSTITYTPSCFHVLIQPSTTLLLGFNNQSTPGITFQRVFWHATDPNLFVLVSSDNMIRVGNIAEIIESKGSEAGGLSIFGTWN